MFQNCLLNTANIFQDLFLYCSIIVIWTFSFYCTNFVNMSTRRNSVFTGVETVDIEEVGVALQKFKVRSSTWFARPRAFGSSWNTTMMNLSSYYLFSGWNAVSVGMLSCTNGSIFAQNLEGQIIHPWTFEFCTKLGRSSKKFLSMFLFWDLMY